MNDRPDALELLRIANHTLAHEILPDAKPDQLYSLRMIANALGIAARELESRDADAESETRGLMTLYKDTLGKENLPQLNRKFAQDIRMGRFEQSTEQEAQLRQHLMAVARAKLAVTYPKGLLGSDKNNI